MLKKDLVDKLKLTLNGFGLEIDMSSQIAKQNISINVHKLYILMQHLTVFFSIIFLQSSYEIVTDHIV